MILILWLWGVSYGYSLQKELHYVLNMFLEGTNNPVITGPIIVATLLSS
jgi:hypothetical protein